MRITTASIAFVAVSCSSSYDIVHAFTSSCRTEAKGSTEKVSTDLFSMTNRRGWLKNVAGVSAASLILGDGGPAKAAVFYDPDRYGDKELKIATVNKLRQNIRDAILQDPSMASQFLKIAVQDALSFNAAKDEGGPDGTIVNVILGGKPALASLKPGATKLAEIAKKIKRTTEITMADIVTFAGAEAIESAGGPRIPVQLGKLDPAKAKEFDYPDLCGSDAANKVVEAFNTSGLSEREVALIYGALGSLETTAKSFKKEDDDFEENEMGDEAVYIPSSFGSPQEIYGVQMGKMDNAVFKNVAKEIKQKKKVDVGVFNDDKVAGWAIKYAGNNNGFLKDLPEAYEKITGLGTRYTGGKVGSLLGGGESEY